ncbi:MAG: hypothetical protein EAY75_08470 [Bacteroidetes bacterium]|nr:MAG: hypothetical protein EAY75_08470 [Bacteroidota bacterium]
MIKLSPCKAQASLFIIALYLRNIMNEVAKSKYVWQKCRLWPLSLLPKQLRFQSLPKTTLPLVLVRPPARSIPWPMPRK